MKRLLAMCAAAALAGVPLSPGLAQEPPPGANLGGYDALASASAVSFQPFLPAFLSTGDVPFEVTVAVSSSRVTSGGNSFGRASVLYPGSAAANLGPLLITGAGLDELGALIPPYPLQAEASQADGEVEASVPPALVMRARGFADEGSGVTRLADVELPGFLRIENVASSATTLVGANEVTSVGHTAVSGVSLLGGLITIEEVRSVSRTSSTGRSAGSSGDTDIVGLRIAGIDVSVTDRGFQVEGAPGGEDVPGGDGPIPGLDPETLLSDLLDALGISLTLFESSVTEGPGRVQRFEQGLVLSIENALGGVGPLPPGRFDIILARASSSALASEPFSEDAEATPFTQTAPPAPSPTDTLGPAPSASSTGSSLSGPPQALTPGSDIGQAAAVASDYEFVGVPLPMAAGLLLAAALAAWYIRSFFRSMMIAGREGDGEGE